MKCKRMRRCRCCKDIFTSDYRNSLKQKYCSKPECRAASKSASQKRWSKNNPNYFKDPIHGERVKSWRLAHPGRNRRKSSGAVLQDDCSQIPPENQDVIPPLPADSQQAPPVLQDFCINQHPIFVGLIAHLTGCVLQDDIAVVTRRLEQLGLDVINPNPGGCYDPQDPALSRSHPLYSRTVQLGGSPSGP